MSQLDKLTGWLRSEQAGQTRDRIGKLLDLMDDYNFVRLAVCVLPGAVAVQIVSKLQVGQPAGMVAAGVLTVGLVVWWKWVAIRNRFAAAQEEADASANEEQYADGNLDGAALMQELVTLHGGDEAAAAHAAMVEMQMDPTLNWDGGVAVALHRKQALNRLAAASRVVRPLSGS
jgi:hypothetical protein